jgi:hypothetical protein
MRTQILLLTLIVSALLFAGCIGGSQNGATGGSTTGGNTQGAANTTANATQHATNATANASGQQPGTSAADQLASLFLGREHQNYKATYVMTYGTTATNTTYTQYVKGDNERMDMNMETMTYEMFTVNGKEYNCFSFKMAGMDNFTCMASSSNESPVSAPSALNESVVSDNNVQLLPPTIIAGIPAICFRTILPAEADSPASSADYCASSDGIMLSMSSSNMTITATAVERNIPDSSFVLPAQVTTLPTG